MHYVNVLWIEHFDDSRVAMFRNVKDAASRSRGVFLAESELVISRVFDTGFTAQALLVSESRFARMATRIHEAQAAQVSQVSLRSLLPQASQFKPTQALGRDPGFEVFVCEQSTLEAIVGFPLHRGCLAICYRQGLPTPQELLARAQTVVVLDDVVDPDNIGSVFRHVAGFGLDGVVLSANAGDPLYRKSIRASMGWVLEVPYARLPNRDSLLPTLHDAGFKTIALTPRRDAPTLRSVVGSLLPTDRVAFLLGAEAPGLPDQTISGATYQARITMTMHVDSFNVATAGALALYELTAAHPNRIVQRNAPPEFPASTAD